MEGGIASLAAAAFLIRDGDIPGQNITILEESAKIGGSLDAAGNPKDGYVMRGGRMFESKYLCTFDLFSSIPTLDESKTVTQEIFQWNETMKTSSQVSSVPGWPQSRRSKIRPDGTAHLDSGTHVARTGGDAGSKQHRGSVRPLVF